jgi:hypothetical protein
MRIFFVASIIWAAVLWPAFAQEPNTVTATVSTTRNVSAGTATFRIQFLDTNLSSVVDTPLNLMQDLGLTPANLTGVSISISQGFVITQYDFTLSVPAAQFGATRDRLLTIQRGLQTSASQAVGWTTTYAASTEETASALAQVLPSLLEQARQRAELLATSMGRTLGQVQTLSAPAVTSTGLSLQIGLTVTYATAASGG